LIGYFLGKSTGNRAGDLPQNSPLKGYYETLRVSPTAKIEEIKQSYRELEKQYHPDLQSQADEEKISLLKEKMSTINEAYREIRKVRKF
jgi:DnaJ-class molecular chaperone